MDTQRDQKPTAPVQPVASIPVQGGVVRGEHEVATPITSRPDGLVASSEQDPTLHPEVQQSGVKVVPIHPQLTLEDKKAGINHAGEQISVHDMPSIVRFPSKEEIERDKKFPSTDSRPWKATIFGKVMKILRKAA